MIMTKQCVMNKNHVVRLKIYVTVLHLNFVNIFQWNLFVSAHNEFIYDGIYK